MSHRIIRHLFANRRNCQKGSQQAFNLFTRKVFTRQRVLTRRKVERVASEFKFKRRRTFEKLVQLQVKGLFHLDLLEVGWYSHYTIVDGSYQRIVSSGYPSKVRSCKPIKSREVGCMEWGIENSFLCISRRCTVDHPAPERFFCDAIPLMIPLTILTPYEQSHTNTVIWTPNERAQ